MTGPRQGLPLRAGAAALRRVGPALALSAALGGPILAGPAVADGAAPAGTPGPAGTPSTPAQPQATPDAVPPSIQSSFGPLGDPGGLRAALAGRGVTYSLTFIGETLANPTGGIRQGAIGEGLLNLQVDADLAAILGWTGAKLHANGYKIFGDGLTRSDLLDLSVASGIEALPSTRLYEAWFEQTALDGRVGLRLGQLGADSEFIISQYATLFINSTFGWPNFTAYDLPSGGPAYPLATPGARLKLAPDPHWTLLAAVFDGNPAGAQSATVDPQKLDRYGTNFRVTDPPLFIAEAAYGYGDKEGRLLPGTAKFGVWEDFGSFASSIPTAAGLTLGSGAGQLSGNDGIYGIVDQMVYRLPGTDDGAVGVFARLSGEPGDRNLISFYADAGVSAKGLLPGRPDDTAGLSFAYSQISPAARRTDREERATLGAPYPIRSNELLFEATWQAQVAPGFTLQPDLQYVVRPGGGIPDPLRPGYRPVPDAAVIGLRATIVY